MALEAILCEIQETIFRTREKNGGFQIEKVISVEGNRVRKYANDTVNVERSGVLRKGERIGERDFIVGVGNRGAK